MTEKPKGRLRRLWRWRPLLAYGVVVLAVFLLAWSGLANWLSARHDAQVPRDAETGIRIGAEAYDLGDKDAARAVLFVHGFVGSPNNFWTLPEQVAAQGWRAKAVLLPGHGTSPYDFEGLDADDLIAGVRDAVEELRADHETVVIVAHSMGAALSVLVAADLPVDGLVLGAPYFGVQHRWYYGLRPETWAKLLSPVVRWTYRPVWSRPVNMPEARAELVTYTWIPVEGALSAIEVSRRANDPAVLGAVTCPVLVLHGMEDSVTSPAASQRALNAMGSADKEMQRYDNSEHVLYWDYDSEEIAARVLDFLGRFDESGTRAVGDE